MTCQVTLSMVFSWTLENTCFDLKSEPIEDLLQRIKGECRSEKTAMLQNFRITFEHSVYYRMEDNELHFQHLLK